MKECILSYDDMETIPVDYEKRAVSTLQQLRGMLDNAEVWHKQEISLVQDMEKFSGMPNLLSYVDYISTQKARNEKINNLMFKIDSEYRAIMNLFHIEELMQSLKENKELLKKAIIILNEFKASVRSVLDSEYNDLYKNYTSIYVEYEDKRSAYMLDLAKKRPIVISDIGKLYSSNIDKQLGLNSVLDEVTGHRIETELTRSLHKEYGSDDSKVLKIDAVCVTYVKILSEVSKNAMSTFVSTRKDELGKELEKEQRAISAILSFIWEEHLKNLRNIVKKYSDKLVEECSEQLNIEIPEFQIVFSNGMCKKNFYLSGLNTNGISKVIESAMYESNRFNQGVTGGFVGWIRKILGKENEITLGNVLKIYNSKQIGIDLKGIYEKNGNLAKYLEGSVCEPMKNAMNEFLNKMISEIMQLDNNINSVTAQIEESIDESKKYQQNVEKLEKERQSLLALKTAVSAFSNSWKEVVME